MESCQGSVFERKRHRDEVSYQRQIVQNRPHTSVGRVNHELSGGIWQNQDWCRPLVEASESFISFRGPTELLLNRCKLVELHVCTFE